MLSELTSMMTLLESISWPTIRGGKLTALILLAFFVMLAVLESKAPKRKLSPKGLRRSYRTNLSLFIFNNETIITCFIMFHHTNFSFKGENLLGQMFIVPNLHRAHHSIERSEHDHNYGAVLSLWDRLFGTLAELEPAKIGIKGDKPLTNGPEQNA